MTSEKKVAIHFRTEGFAGIAIAVHKICVLRSFFLVLQLQNFFIVSFWDTTYAAALIFCFDFYCHVYTKT